MFVSVVAELIGTFVLIAVILITGEAIPIAMALAVAIYIGGGISGGHFNPTVSTIMMANGTITAHKWAAYICAQIVGGILALLYYNANYKKTMGKRM